MKLQDFVQNKPVLETKQLILRPLRKEDVSDLKEWLGDSSIYQYWGKRPGKSDLNPELLFQKPEKPTKSFHWGIVHKQDYKVIGDMWVYLIENDRMAKVSFRLSPAYQGNRLMTEALARVAIFCFEETELQRLWADVHICNIASFKTLEKAGFKREGLNRFSIINEEHAHKLVFDYIETFYNTVRIHSHCGFMSPNAFEDMHDDTLT